MSKFKKGQKVWLVQMGRDALYDVVAATVTKPPAGPEDCIMVRIEFEADDERDSVVVDRHPKDVRPSEREALALAIQMCTPVITKWTAQQTALIARLMYCK